MGPKHQSGISRRRFLQAGLGTVAGLAVAGPARAVARFGGSHAPPLMLAWARPSLPSHWAALGGFDLTHLASAGGVEILLWPGDEARLRATGIPHEITVGDLIGRDRAMSAPARSSTLANQPGERADYRHLSDYERDLHDLAAARPEMARVLALPEPSAAGRIVYGIEIADAVRRPDGRPTLYMDGLHHAREWPSGEMAIMFAHDLVTSFGNDPRVTRLLRSLRVVVVPVVNPDGFVYSRTHLYDDRSSFTAYPAIAAGLASYWRKNRRTFTHDAGFGHLDGHAAYGVDPNRNYSFGFGGPGTSPIQLDQTHRGPSPFSEPETRNVSRTVLSRTVTAVLSHHTYSDLVLRPWGDTRNDSPDESLLRSLGDSMAEHNGYRSQKGIDLYPTTGTMSDWSYAAVGALGYTFEHGRTFHPPYGAYVPDYYATNREPFLILAEAAADPAHHAVIRGRTTTNGRGGSEAVTIRKAVKLPTENGSHEDPIEIALSSDSDGRFEVHLGPSTPPLAETAEHYEVRVGRTTVGVVVNRGERVDVGRIPS